MTADVRTNCVPSARPPRFFLTNQAAGPLTIELLTYLHDRGIACRVLAGSLSCAPEPLAGIACHKGRQLVKHSALLRLWTWGLFTLQGIWAIIRNRREDVLVVTNPPTLLLAMPLLKRLFGVRYALLQYDIYPDIAERMGMFKPGGWIARLWRRLSRKSMLGARAVITLSPDMADVLRSHLRSGDDLPIEIIPTWVDTEAIRPRERCDNPFAREHGLVDKFVVMYAGSFGAANDIDSIIDAAGLLTDLPDVHFMLIGGGTRQAEIAERVASLGLKNLTLLPLQPLVTMPQVLPSADCQVVTLDEVYAGVAMPSKTYPAMAAGCALLAVCPPGSALTTLATGDHCGLHVLPRHPAELAAAIRRLRDDAALLKQCKERGRQLAEERSSQKPNLEKFHAVLAKGFGWPVEGLVDIRTP